MGTLPYCCVEVFDVVRILEITRRGAFDVGGILLVCLLQLQVKIASLTDDLLKLEQNKRKLEESQDSLVEEVTKLQAQGQQVVTGNTALIGWPGFE